MVQPVIGAIEAWLAIYMSLPLPIVNLMNLSFGLLFVSVFVNFLFQVGGSR